MKNDLILLAITVFLFSCHPKVHYANPEMVQGEDATPYFTELLAYCKQNNVDKLVIPQGTYHCYSERATGRYVFATNNDDGLKRILFDMVKFNNFELDASGSTFVMHGQICPFEVYESDNVTLRNLTIDWDKPFYFQGEVLAVNNDERSFDLKILEECDYEIVGGELIFLEKPGFARKPWKEWAVRIQPEVGWEQTMDWNIWYDTETRVPAYKGAARHIHTYNEKRGVRYRAKEIKPGLVRLYDAVNVMPKIGWSVVVKGIKSPNRVNTAIHLSNSSNLILDSVIIHHAGGMGIIAEKCNNVILNACKVTLPEGSQRMVTTTADATHFVGCKGKLVVKDCFFENMLDDATNVHGVYTRVEELIDDCTIEVRLLHGQQLGFVFASVGDSIRLLEKTTMKPYATFCVEKVNIFNNERIRLTLDREVRSVLLDHSVAENMNDQASLHFTQSTVRRNRARSILISTLGDVLIDKNNFETCTSISLLFAGDATFWHESGPVQNVRIVGNKFKDFGLETPGAPLVVFAPHVSIPDDLNDAYYYHRNVVMEDNDCEVFSRCLVKATSLENFIFRNNVVRESISYPMVGSWDRAFVMNYCKDLLVEDNLFPAGCVPQAAHTNSLNIVVKE